MVDKRHIERCDLLNPIRPQQRHKHVIDQYMWDDIPLVKQMEIKLLALQSLDLLRKLEEQGLYT